MKFKTLKPMFVAVIGLCAVFSVQAEERVAATVNGTPIMESQVRAAMGKGADRQKALNKLINKILVKQAMTDGPKVNSAQIDSVIEEIAAQNGLTFGQLLDALDAQGVDYDAYRQQIAQQLFMSGVRNRAIGQGIEITREEVDALAQKMLDDVKKKGKDPKVLATQYEVRHILLKLNPLLDDAKAKAQLTQIRADIQSGKMSFADAALKYSKDYLSGANGGNLGYAFPEVYVGTFAEKVRRTKQGTISQPFKTEFGWHILEVVNRRQADRTEEAYHQRAYETLVNQQLQKLAKDWTQALRQKADIKYFN